VNKDIKKVMIDSVPRDQISNLISRCLQGLFIKVLQYELMKYFKLTTISIIANLSPLFTIFLGYLFIKEKQTLDENL
jgi:drug/metabolite transporter (DMT)-like permease